MDLKTICLERWDSLSAAERAIDIGNGMLTSISDKGSTTTRTLRKILDALDPTDAQRRAILAQFGLVPAVVGKNAGVVGTGGLAWPGPWFVHNGIWVRHWVSDEVDDVAVLAEVYLPYSSECPDSYVVETLGGIVETAAQARAADAILATICAGEDPHPYPAELLATDGGED